MERVTNFIPKIIAPWPKLILLAALLTILLIVQTGIYNFIQNNTAVWQGTCSFKEWNQGGELGMVVDCGEHGKITLRYTSFIRSYLNNPGPVTCELSAANLISCNNRPPPQGEAS